MVIIKVIIKLLLKKLEMLCRGHMLLVILIENES